ncbi:hypothetical protein ACWDTT_15965 [Streptosporangium sandarakinum]
MKKSDIQTGVLYAYGSPDYVKGRVYVISTDALVEEVRRPRSDEPRYRLSKADRPRRSNIGGKHGYPIVHVNSIDPKVQARAAAMTLDDFLALTSIEPERGLLTDVLMTSRQILGPYDEVMAEQEAEREIAEARRAEQKAEKERRDARGAELDARAKALGITGWINHETHHAHRVTLYADDLERLITLAEFAGKVDAIFDEARSHEDVSIRIGEALSELPEYDK